MKSPQFSIIVLYHLTTLQSIILYVFLYAFLYINKHTFLYEQRKNSNRMLSLQFINLFVNRNTFINKVFSQFLQTFCFLWFFITQNLASLILQAIYHNSSYISFHFHKTLFEYIFTIFVHIVLWHLALFTGIQYILLSILFVL